MAASAAADAWRSPEPARDAFLPLVVFPRERSTTLEASAAGLRDVIARYLPRAGAILFRGFRVSEDADFEHFVSVAGTAERPVASAARVWAWCAVPRRGQRIVLTDRRELYRAVPARVRRRWAERDLSYERHDERGCSLLSRRLSPVSIHPLTRELSWAQPEHTARAGAFGGLLGVASAAEELRGAMDGARWTVRHGDGTELDELDVYEVNSAIEACRSELRLEARDVLVMDPALTAHATAPSADAGIAIRRER
ncbi:MAG TPA: hypothetical protein VMG12_23570 [Polyangiaceae bacterium]|nr:hypothetical protein [Polyangiaceae bacterium]